MDEVKAEFLKNQEIQHSLWLRYIDDISLCGLKEKKSSLSFLNALITFILIRNLSCTVNFIDLINGAIHTSLYVKSTDGHQYIYLPYLLTT